MDSSRTNGGMLLLKRIRKILKERRNAKQIREYCASESGRQRGHKYLNFILLLLVFSFLALWSASGYREAISNLLVAGAALILTFSLLSRREYKQIIAECRNKLGEREYRRRLDKAADDDVLQVLKEKITAAYPAVEDLARHEDMLVGRYRGNKLAVIYRYVGEDDLVGTRDVLYILHNCRERGIKEVRIFTNGEFGKKQLQLGERYDINLKLYNGSALKAFMKGSSLYPSESEMDSLLKKESEKRQRRIDLLKKELLQKNKFKNYLVYGLILFILSWYGIGVVYWNVFFGVLLFIMALSSLLARREQIEEEQAF